MKYVKFLVTIMLVLSIALSIPFTCNADEIERDSSEIEVTLSELEN